MRGSKGIRMVKSNSHRTELDVGLRDILDRLIASVNCLQDERSRPLNPIKGNGQCFSITAVQVDVVAGCLSDVEAYSLTHDERDGLCLQFSRVARLRPIVKSVEQFVRVLVRQDRELGCRRQASENLNTPAAGKP